MFKINLLLFFLLPVVGTQAQKKKDGWTYLFNGRDLSGWNTYLKQPLDSSGRPWHKEELGFNNDPQKVFTVVEDETEKVIRISGQSWGALSTRNEYANYHLQLKFRWGNYTWAGKRGKPMDSGLLYHSVGEPKIDGWMVSQEFQIEEGNCGDYWTIGPVRVDVPSTLSKYSYVYDPSAPLNTVGEKGINWCHRPVANEKPAGEWNTLDLYCSGDTSVHMVNGEVVMVLYRSALMVDGRRVPLKKGKIQLQSEGAELFYKDLRIRKIDRLPDFQ